MRSEPGGSAHRTLDHAELERRLNDTSHAERVLAQVYDPSPKDGQEMPEATRSLLQSLAGHPSLTQDAFRALAAQHGLMPHAAIEHLNSWAVKETGAPLLQPQPDGYEVNQDTAKDLAW